MNVADDHSRWDEDLAPYAIGALDANDTVAFAAHLAHCDRCRGELHRLVPAVELLPASVEQLEPPPALRGRILAAIAEQEPAGAAVSPAAAPPRSSRRRASLRERIRGWHVPAIPAALTGAAIAAAFAVGFLIRGGGEDATTPQRTTVPVVAAAPGASDVRAQLISDGGAWHLDVSRLPQPRSGRVYQAWVMRRDRAVEPSTVFVLASDGSSTVAIPQSLGDGDQVLVTQEPAGGSPAPTSRPLLSATV